MLLSIGLLVASMTVALMVTLDDYRVATKVAVATLVGATVLMQFEASTRQHVHFVVPIVIQIGVVSWYWLANQFE